MKDITNITKEQLKKDWTAEIKDIDRNVFSNALDYAVSNVSDNMEELKGKTLVDAGENGEYPAAEVLDVLPWDWGASFWVGMIWLAYDVTGEDKYKEAGLRYSELFAEGAMLHNSHDIGFLYTLSCVAAYKETGDALSKEGALKAAQKLLGQYMEKCGAFQQHGSPTDKSNDGLGNAIIDCCMNLPLLYWASEATGDPEFRDKAYSHIQNASGYLVRDNGATHQNIQFDVETGKIEKIHTTQGDGHEEGCWSRGQAWAIYGFVLSYLYTGDKRLIELSKICANYFLNRLQSDNCCNWDFLYRDDNDQRDTSAAAIAACGLLELAKQLPLSDTEREQYEAAAQAIILSLTDNYLYTKKESKNALLKAAVYAFKSGGGVNEPNIWGDYFYMGALVRLLHVHKIFW